MTQHYELTVQHKLPIWADKTEFAAQEKILIEIIVVSAVVNIDSIKHSGW
jgi:hypothetical protein